MVAFAGGWELHAVNSFPADMNCRMSHSPCRKRSPIPGWMGRPFRLCCSNRRVKKPGPAAILIHGGPDWFFEMTWYPLMAHMASRGWVVLVPNYRGSTGYGRAWQEASRFDFGGVDNDDVAAGAQFLLRNGLADPERIGITGRSHGGYLTMTCLTKYPDLWAAGSAVVPFHQLVHQS